METKRIRLDPDNIDLDIIKQAAAIIDAGGFVAFPTETVYGIAACVKSGSLLKLDHIKGRTDNKYYTLHIEQSNEVLKYIPTIGLRARKLIQNAWPGPLTLVFELDQNDIEIQRTKIEKEMFENLYKHDTIGIRCPDNTIALALLAQTNNPVVAPSANITGWPPAVTADQVLAQLSGKIEFVMDGGQCKYKKSSTVAKIGKAGLEILRNGVYSQVELEVLSQIKFLFVCTGNTCRSPMAEGIFKKYLAQKLNYKVDDLEKMGYRVSSAGTIGSTGYPASAEAVAACTVQGIDIGTHRNQKLSRELIEESDFIFAMERMHLARILELEPEAGNRCLLLAGDKEIPDPIGCPQRIYDNCAILIINAVKERIGELVT